MRKSKGLRGSEPRKQSGAGTSRAERPEGKESPLREDNKVLESDGMEMDDVKLKQREAVLSVIQGNVNA